MLTLAVTLVLLVFTRLHYSSAIVDLSWPNCSHLPRTYFSKAVVGVTGGLDFHVNKCSGNEASLAETYEIYANTGNPGLPRIKRFENSPFVCTSQDALVCYSFNYGYNAGIYALNQANLANLHSAFWWLDVETDNSWTVFRYANRADIYGMLEALASVRFLHPKLGIYTTTNQWRAIVGNWSLGLPLWLGTGSTSIVAARQACSVQSVTGSPVSMTQYISSDGMQDYDYNCHVLAPDSYF
jgi:hypothetical protein